MFDNNTDNEKVYQVLASHLISKKAVGILLKMPFTTDDYYEFIEERKQTILLEIKNRLLDKVIDLPENLKVLDAKIETAELKFSALIKKKKNIQNIQDFETHVPSHLLPKLKRRIDKEFRKNPTLAINKSTDVDFWFQFLDLQELKDILTNKKNWNEFADILSSKEKVMAEFKDMGDLRNCIRHSREADKITRMKGEAATLWFEEQLKE